MPEETISRETAVGRIRIKMLELSESGKSACRIAAERNILCKGFHRDTDEQLRDRYEPYVGGIARLTRSDLERVANRWQLARQRTEDTALACDVQYRHYQTCRGWNDFSNEQLADFCVELTGRRPKVVGEISLPNI